MKNETTTTPTTEITNADLSNVQNEFFDKFDAIKEEDMKGTDAEYLEFSEGEVHNLIFTGIETTNFNENGVQVEKDIATFEGRNGWKFVNANSVIVNSMKRILAPAPVRIICTGEQKNAKGNKYKTFKIFTL